LSKSLKKDKKPYNCACGGNDGSDGKTPSEIGMRDKVGYAMGDFACNMSFSLITAYLYIFYTQYIGISTAVFSAVILGLKIWDAVNDPIMGANIKTAALCLVLTGTLLMGAALLFMYGIGKKEELRIRAELGKQSEVDVNEALTGG